MKLKRKLYTDSTKEEKDAKLSEKSKKTIYAATSAGLGALGGLGITKLLNKDNLKKIADKVEYKKISGNKAEGLSEYYLARGPIAEKIAKKIGSEELAKSIKSGKGVIISGAAIGAGLLSLKRKKNKKKNA